MVHYRLYGYQCRNLDHNHGFELPPKHKPMREIAREWASELVLTDVVSTNPEYADKFLPFDHLE